MANTQPYKTIIEEWFRRKLRIKYNGYKVEKDKVNLNWGGKFEYDAVVKNGNTLYAVYCLSCSEYITSGNNPGAGKFRKIQSDVLMMVGTNCSNKILAFTGKTMYEKVKKEQENGRMPSDIKLEYFDLSQEDQSYSTLIQSLSADCVAEVTPDGQYE